jgi:hypothetical protein
MAKLVVNSESLVSVANAIRTKGGTSESLTFPQGFVDAVGAIDSGGGGTEEIEQIIDESGVLESTDETVTVEKKVEQLIDKANIENFYYQRTSKVANAQDWFNGFNGEKLPRSNFVKATVTVNFAYGSTITDVDYYLNWGAESNITINATNAFMNTVNLTHMVGVKTDKCLNMSNFFRSSAIEEVDEPFNLSSITQSSYLNNAFSCVKLREVRFVAKSIKWSIVFTSAVLSIGNVFNLNDTENVGSVQSIINGLATLAEGATAQTLTLSKNLPLTEEQKQAITTAVNNKGWTLAFA